MAAGQLQGKVTAHVGTVDIKEIIQIVQTGGMVGLLALVLWGGFKRWWVFGWQYAEKVEELEEWKTAAKSSTSAAEEAVKIAALLRQMELHGGIDVPARAPARRTRREA